MKLTGNTILITGGSAGIGFELAKKLSERENTVIITGRSKAKLAAAKKQLPKIHIIQSDVSDAKAIESLSKKLIKEFPQLNILINNAGIMKNINFHSTAGSLEDLTHEIDINLMGPIRLSKQLLPHLKKMPAAAIVNVSSGLAFVPLPIAPIYCATKAALHSFSQSLRVQLKNTEVRVFEVAPPTTQTEMIAQANAEDLKGVSIMSVADMVNVTLMGIEKNQYEIRPGQSNQLKFMSRLAPNFILKQLSKPVDRMLAG